MSDPTKDSASTDRRLLYCHCTYSRVVPKDVKGEVLKVLAESGRAFDAVPDLCELAARCDPSLKKLVDPGQGPVDIVACYPRAVRWLFHAAESPLPEEGFASTTCAPTPRNRFSESLDWQQRPPQLLKTTNPSPHPSANPSTNPSTNQ